MQARTDQLSDEALLAGMGAGDSELSAAFVRRFQGLVFGVAVTVVGETIMAENIAQQVFERARRDAPGSAACRSWLRAITHELAVDAVRARASAPLGHDRLPAVLTAMTGVPQQAVGACGDPAELRGKLAALPEPQARAVVMAAIYGMTARHIADSECVPVATARTWLRDGMGKLRSAEPTVRAA